VERDNAVTFLMRGVKGFEFIVPISCCRISGSSQVDTNWTSIFVDGAGAF